VFKLSTRALVRRWVSVALIKGTYAADGERHSGRQALDGGLSRNRGREDQGHDDPGQGVAGQLEHRVEEGGAHCAEEAGDSEGAEPGGAGENEHTANRARHAQPLEAQGHATTSHDRLRGGEHGHHSQGQQCRVDEKGHQRRPSARNRSGAWPSWRRCLSACDWGPGWRPIGPPSTRSPDDPAQDRGSWAGCAA
jgi:hypothetical protein